jgi:hypothetical protein
VIGNDRLHAGDADNQKTTSKNYVARLKRSQRSGARKGISEFYDERSGHRCANYAPTEPMAPGEFISRHE